MKKILTLISVTGRFEAIHSWPDCPHEDVSFLKQLHRHIFHVIVKLEVKHNDRDLEFIRIKRILTSYLFMFDGQNIGSHSCEMLCDLIANHLDGFTSMNGKVKVVSVSEDGENGAEAYYE
jgi:hypothetical protein